MNKSNARYSSRWQQTQTKARMLYLTELAEYVCVRLVWDVFGLSQTLWLFQRHPLHLYNMVDSRCFMNVACLTLCLLFCWWFTVSCFDHSYSDFLCVSRVCLTPLDLFNPADNCCVISYSKVQFWKTSSDFSEHKHHARRGVSSSVVWLQSRTGRADAQYVAA